MNQRFKIFLVVLFLAFSTGLFSQEATNNHHIRKGDGLSINVMGHPEFSLESVIVMPDGYVQFPGLGSIQAAGMSINDFTARVTEQIGKYVLNPVVTVFVSALPNQIINVVGFVNKPGQVPIFEQISLMDAISKAGGIKQIRKCKTIMIIRSDNTYEKVKVKDIFSDDITKRMAVKMLYVGDTIYVIEPKDSFNWSLLTFITQLAYIGVMIFK